MKASKAMSAVNSLHGPGPVQIKSPASLEQRAYEPSMEEILASIRRIIADDQSLPGRPAPESPAAGHDTPVQKGGEHAGQSPFAPKPPAPPPQPATVVPSGHPADAATGSPASVTLLHQAGPARRPEATASGADGALHGSQPGHHSIPDPHSDMREHGHIAAPQFVSPAGPAMPPQDHADPHEDAGQVDAVDDDASDGRDAPALFSTATDQSVTRAFNTLAAMRLADNSDDLLDLARDMIRPLLRSWLDDNLPGMVERMVRAEIERVARGGR